MHGSEEYDQKDHFEEDQKYVTVGKQKANASQHRTGGTLNNWHAQRVLSLTNFIVGSQRFRGHVRMTNVCRKINGKTDAHNQIDHWDRIQIDAPQWHITGHAQFDADNAERHPEGAQNVRHKNVRYDGHDQGTVAHALYGGGSNQFELIEEHKVRMENGGIDVGRFAKISQIFDHLFLVIGVGDVDGLNEEAWSQNARFVLVEFDVQRVRIAGYQPVLFAEEMENVFRFME